MVRPLGETYTVMEWNAATGGRDYVTYKVWAHKVNQRGETVEQVSEIGRRPVAGDVRVNIEPKENK